MTKNSLAIAIEALSWMAYSGIGERPALFKAADEIGAIPSDLRQAHGLIMETIRFQNRAEYLISKCVSKERFSGAPHGIASFLKILAYLASEVNTSDRELERTVSWARQVLGWKELHPYETAIALIASRRLRVDTVQLTELERLSLETCHPAWLVRRIIEVFGRTFALRLLQQDLKQLPTYVRLNPMKSKSITEFESKIIPHLSPVKELEGVWRLNGPRDRIVRSKSWSDGEIVIQDLASITAGAVASPRVDESVLDLCAAPGNKTSHLAAMMENKGRICSIDNSRKRLSQWHREMERTGCAIAHPVCADASSLPLTGEFDVVLIDPSCSNTGALGKNPSIKWKITPTRVNEHAKRQHAILREASKHLRSGGTLVYCTCSILPEENEEIIYAFLSRNPDFRLVPQIPFLGSPGIRGYEQCQRFYPHLHDCNGYFIAKLKRTD